MYLYDDRVELAPKQGLTGLILQGTKGKKIIYYSDISSVEFKNCGWTHGFFEFTFPGGIDSPGGAISGADNDNRFTFGKVTIGAAKKMAKEMEPINNFIQKKINEYKNKSRAQVVQQTSNADEILKYKNLLDEGIISKSEFEEKKKQLLGL